MKVGPNIPFDQVTSMKGFVELEYEHWWPSESSRSLPPFGREHVPANDEEVVVESVNPLPHSNFLAPLVIYIYILSLLYFVLLMKLFFLLTFLHFQGGFSFFLSVHLWFMPMYSPLVQVLSNESWEVCRDKGRNLWSLVYHFFSRLE